MLGQGDSSHGSRPLSLEVPMSAYHHNPGVEDVPQPPGPTPSEVLGLSIGELLRFQATMGNQAVQGLAFLDVWTWEARGEGRPSPWDRG